MNHVELAWWLAASRGAEDHGDGRGDDGGDDRAGPQERSLGDGWSSARFAHVVAVRSLFLLALVPDV